MLNGGIVLFLAKERAAELQREAERNHHVPPARPRMLDLLLRRRGSSRRASR